MNTAEEERKEAGLKLVTGNPDDCIGCVFHDDMDGCWDGPPCGDMDEILVKDTE